MKKINKFTRKFLLIILLLVLAMLTGRFSVEKVIVDGSSMYPTMKNGEYGLADRIAYKIFGIDRFDVIVFTIENPNTKIEEQWVKRVIGLPGETVVYKDDKLYVDGVYVEEDFISDSAIKCTCSEPVVNGFCSDGVTVGEDEYFVLGDNRDNSYDSRYLPSLIKKSQIDGKGILIIADGEIVNDQLVIKKYKWPRLIGC